MNSIHREIENPTEFGLNSIGIRLNPMKKADPLIDESVLLLQENREEEEKNRNREKWEKKGNIPSLSLLEYVFFFFCSVKNILQTKPITS